MIKAVIFDMDGLLVDSEPLWHQTNQGTYKKFGITLADDAFHHMRGRTIRENLEYFHAQQPWAQPDLDESEKMIAQEMVRLIKAHIQLKPGVDKALQICKDAKLPVAIASSSPPEIIGAVVDTLKLREHFDHIYSAYMEPHGKPHPGVFISVAQRLGVAPRDCLVFEDAPAGVLAAKAANMVCIAVPAPELSGHAYVKTADVVLDSLEDFSEDLLGRF